MFEVNQDHQVIHLKSLEMPESTSRKGKCSNDGSSSTVVTDSSLTKPQEPVVTVESSDAEQELFAGIEVNNKDDSSENTPWNDQFSEKLGPYLSEASIGQLRNMVLEGREPPRVSDSGWGGRSVKTSEDTTENADVPKPSDQVPLKEETGNRGKSRGGRGGRGGRGRGRGGRQGGEREDHRKVLSEVSCPGYFTM